VRRVNPVKARRQQLGMSQQTLAHEAGVSLRTVQNVEGGADVRVSTLVAFAKALRCKPAALLPAEAAA
jgi:transcriptional regulator with XRE-family HTH domain